MVLGNANVLAVIGFRDCTISDFSGISELQSVSSVGIYGTRLNQFQLECYTIVSDDWLLKILEEKSKANSR
jgi:hypothetical protein